MSLEGSIVSTPPRLDDRVRHDCASASDDMSRRTWQRSAGLIVWMLRRRPINTVDAWDGKTYRRGLVFGNRPVEMAVTQTGSTLEVTVTGVRLHRP